MLGSAAQLFLAPGAIVTTTGSNHTLQLHSHCLPDHRSRTNSACTQLFTSLLQQHIDATFDNVTEDDWKTHSLINSSVLRYLKLCASALAFAHCCFVVAHRIKLGVLPRTICTDA